MFWRRGWDSNPRNGSPFTAFPVLPVQPLLHLSKHCRLPIVDSRLSAQELETYLEDRIGKDFRDQSIGNRQSKIGNALWRRGWDSNPRWPLSHSGFRDRCTNPLCDLSTLLKSRNQIKNLRCIPSCSKKFLHQLAAFCFQNTFNHLDSVIEEVSVADAKA